MNRIWSVFTGPCLVETVVPSMSGSRSRCTPSRETSPPTRPSRAQILSSSSRNTMPLFSTARIDSCTSCSWSSRRSDSSLIRMSCDSCTVTRLVLVRPPSPLPKMSPMEMAPTCAPGMPGISNSGIAEPDACTSISISLSSSSPARSFLRNDSLVAALALAPTSALITRSSAATCARAATSLRLLSRVRMMATSTRSRTICSTSRPTYPTSVNLVASTLRNGAPASLARRLEISVLPTPVGPIIKMFFGSTSSRRRSSSCSRRQRLRSAIATARLASVCPMMKRSSSETISRGEKSVIGPHSLRLGRQRFDRHAAVGIDADVGGDRQGLAYDGFGVEIAVDERAGGGQRIIAAGADAHHASLRLQHVAGAGEHQRDVVVGDDHHRLEATQIAVGSPIFGELNRRAGQLAGILLELAFQPLEQRKCIGGGAREAADDVALAQPAHLLGIGLYDSLADRDLAVAAHDDEPVLADRQDGRCVPEVGLRGLHQLGPGWEMI